MAQAAGILAVIMFLLSFQLKTRKNIIIVNATSRFLYILQYVLLGAFEGAVLDFAGFLSSVIAKYKETYFIKKYFVAIVILINLILLFLGIILYENIFSIFAILGITFEVTALWLSKEKNIRFLSFIAAPFWFMYNMANSAYGSSVGNILAMLSIGVAIFRYDIKNK